MKRYSVLLVLMVIVLICGAVVLTGCGGNTSTPTSKTNPLDPQGNWLFNINGSPFSLHLGGTLFELNPPVVTSSLIGPITTDFVCDGSFTINGTASGVSDITLTAQQVNNTGQPIAITLTGTIAPDQEHMSGNWTLKTTGSCLTQTSGTWDAQLLAPVTGNWAGTLSNDSINLMVTAALVENTDQTKPDMGKVSGSITVLGSPCFPNSDTLPLTTTVQPNIHNGETLILNTVPDVNGVTISTIGSVTTDAAKFKVSVFTVNGGICDGKRFEGSLSHN